MALPHVLLTVLLEEPATGYDLTKAFDERLRYFWQASHQQVYRELATLLAEGLVKVSEVAQANRPDKRVYRITAAGKATLRAWLAEAPATRRVNDDLMIKLLGGQLVGRARMIDMLEGERRSLEERLAEYSTIEKMHFAPGAVTKMNPHERAMYLALRRGQTLSRAHLDWLDEAIRLLKRWPDAADYET